MKGEDRRRKKIIIQPCKHEEGKEVACVLAALIVSPTKRPFSLSLESAFCTYWRLIVKRKYFLLVGECCHSCWRWLQSSCSRWKQCWWWLGNYYDIDDDELQKCLLWRWWLQYSFTADDDDCAITGRSAGEDLCWPKLLMGSFPPELPLSLFCHRDNTMVMMWLLMKCKRSIFTVNFTIPLGNVFSYWVMVSIIQILVWLCSSTLVIFPKKSPRVSQSDGAGSKWYGMLVCFFTADDEDLLDISLVALTNRRFYGNCTHVK